MCESFNREFHFTDRSHSSDFRFLLKPVVMSIPRRPPSVLKTAGLGEGIYSYFTVTYEVTRNSILLFYFPCYHFITPDLIPWLRY